MYEKYVAWSIIRLVCISYDVFRRKKLSSGKQKVKNKTHIEYKNKKKMNT